MRALYAKVNAWETSASPMLNGRQALRNLAKNDCSPIRQKGKKIEGLFAEDTPAQDMEGIVQAEPQAIHANLAISVV